MPRPPSTEIQKAVDLLRQGEVIGMPTETVYGLAGDVFNESAVQKIFSTKQRPFFDPLIVHVANAEDVHKLVEDVPAAAQVLMKNFWPGPLTLILPKKSSVSDLVTSGLTTVGVRMPNHPVARELIQLFGSPLAAPSANLFGRTSPTTAKHVQDEFKHSVFVLDGGPSEIGLESTVVGFENDTILIYRPGAVTAQMARVALVRAGISFEVLEKESNVAPGHLQHHYMPSIPLIIVKAGADISEVENAARPTLKLSEWRPANLNLHSDPVIAARELYSGLRRCSESGANVIVVEKSQRTENELWFAIWNRLEKAASLSLV